MRTAASGAPGLQPALTRAIRGVEPGLTVTYRALADRIHDQLTEVRTIAMLSGFFGALALVLAAIGLYGVTSYGVNERRREIGIRLTLGAGRAAAERFVLGRVARLVAIGVALGLAASVALSPVVRTLLYELEPRDPATIALAAVVLTIVGLLAGWLPARRSGAHRSSAGATRGLTRSESPACPPPAGGRRDAPSARDEWRGPSAEPSSRRRAKARRRTAVRTPRGRPRPRVSAPNKSG